MEGGREGGREQGREEGRVVREGDMSRQETKNRRSRTKSRRQLCNVMCKKKP